MLFFSSNFHRGLSGFEGKERCMSYYTWTPEPLDKPWMQEPIQWLYLCWAEPLSPLVNSLLEPYKSCIQIITQTNLDLSYDNSSNVQNAAMLELHLPNTECTQLHKIYWYSMSLKSLEGNWPAISEISQKVLLFLAYQWRWETERKFSCDPP
jgi:hypothetical protein